MVPTRASIISQRSIAQSFETIRVGTFLRQGVKKRIKTFRNETSWHILSDLTTAPAALTPYKEERQFVLASESAAAVQWLPLGVCLAWRGPRQD